MAHTYQKNTNLPPFKRKSPATPNSTKTAHTQVRQKNSIHVFTPVGFLERLRQLRENTLPLQKKKKKRIRPEKVRVAGGRAANSKRFRVADHKPDQSRAGIQAGSGESGRDMGPAQTPPSYPRTFFPPVEIARYSSDSFSKNGG